MIYNSPLLVASIRFENPGGNDETAAMGCETGVLGCDLQWCSNEMQLRKFEISQQLMLQFEWIKG